VSSLVLFGPSIRRIYAIFNIAPAPSVVLTNLTNINPHNSTIRGGQGSDWVVTPITAFIGFASKAPLQLQKVKTPLQL